MLVSKGIKLGRFIKLTGHHIIWLLLVMSAVATLYYFKLINFYIPWLPVSVIGTAVAFYVGFKNNQAYDRMWEARKIWGGIVNESRSWGMMVDGFVTNKFENSIVESEINSIKQRLVYRHIAWMYSHRSQLLIPTEWEHISQKGPVGYMSKKMSKKFGVGLIDDEFTRTELERYIPKDEYDRLVGSVNTATQIINEQSRDLKVLRDKEIIDDFKHMQMMDVLRSFYTLQGRNERIKKFPLPRQYANISRYFVGIFVTLLPFSMVPELLKITSWGVWVSIPISALIGWVYVMMEIVGDYTENPFQGMANDIPMLSLCRTIEIDLLQMLGETELPPSIKSKNGVLM
jgi:putative membrane protein